MKELEKDFMKLVHGKADGEIIIRNEQPHMAGSGCQIIDDVHIGRSSTKETAEAETIE